MRWFFAGIQTDLEKNKNYVVQAKQAAYIYHSSIYKTSEAGRDACGSFF
jgi:hypothetical protein